MATTIKKQDEILGILSKACGRRELIILATPFLRYESSFVALQPGELHVLATMSREDAVYGLRTTELTIRFPHGLGFYEATVTTLGLGIHEGRRTVRISIPESLRENDQRVAFRVERVGRISVTFGTTKSNLYVAGLVDVSTSGAQLHTQKDIPTEELRIGDAVVLDIPLSDEIGIHTDAVIRHRAGRRIGVQFSPGLPTDTAEPLSRWVFLRREEERERAALRLELGSSPSIRVGTTVPDRGIVLVSPDATLETILRSCLQDVRPLIRLAPAIQELKEALVSNPSLVIVHVEGTGLDERRRMKTLTEAAQRKAPVLLLGTNVDGATLFELSNEWKASSAMVWSPERTMFLQRLIQGILRRHASGGDSPMAPMEDRP